MSRDHEQGNKRASIYDVAELAGVSHMTVSRVVNGSARTSQTARDRVAAAIDQLGYRPSQTARTLAARRGSPDPPGPAAPQPRPAPTISSIVKRVARAFGYTVVARQADHTLPSLLDGSKTAWTDQNIDAYLLEGEHGSALVVICYRPAAN